MLSRSASPEGWEGLLAPEAVFDLPGVDWLLVRTRTPWGKIGQMFRAVQMERHHTKDEILEAYLNQAPYGGNVEGVGAASLLWCGKPARDLTMREAVALSARSVTDVSGACPFLSRM